MSWAKGDDLYDDKPKIKKAWRLSGYAVGLHWMAITASCRHESDGLVDPEWLAERLAVIPRAAGRKAVDTLVKLNLFEPLKAGETRVLVDSKGHEIVLGPLDEDTYVVHDYLDYNDSSVVLRERRDKDSARKAAGGRNGRPPDSTRNPNGIQTESESPDPTRPDLHPPHPPRGGNSQAISPPGERPSGNRKTDVRRWEQAATRFAAAVLPHLEPRQAFGELSVIWMRMGPDGYQASVDEVRSFIAKHKPHLLEGADAA